MASIETTFGVPTATDRRVSTPDRSQARAKRNAAARRAGTRLAETGRVTNIRHALRSFVCILLCACSADATAPEQNDPSESEDALFLSLPCTFREGTENYDGIEGSYERVGPNRRDEIREITISQLTADGREAHYRRRMTRACSSPGCDEDEGTMSLLPDNAAFTNNFAFYPITKGATSAADMVFVLGIRRAASGVVTEMCVARVVTARDVRTPFALRRVP